MGGTGIALKKFNFILARLSQPLEVNPAPTQQTFDQGEASGYLALLSQEVDKNPDFIYAYPRQRVAFRQRHPC